jgi:putative FmdB family regulatory protein
MPTYTYECSKCGEFEVEQSISEAALDYCPRCHGTVKRLITGGGGFILKGSSSPRTYCDREAPCCGRATRCDKPPCG